MKGGVEKIQSTCAELDFSRFMYINDINFGFIVPQMARGRDCDVELFYPDGLTVPVDARCKLETTEISPKSIINSLEIGRKKLPGGSSRYYIHKSIAEMHCGRRERCCNGGRGRKFLRNTDRIVAITFYVSHLETHDSVVMHRHALRELTNETSLFNQGEIGSCSRTTTSPRAGMACRQSGSGWFSFPKEQKPYRAANDDALLKSIYSRIKW
jgi:hypothetical protein